MPLEPFIVMSQMNENKKKLIKNQLSLVLKSSYFSSAKQMQRFLEYVVEKTLIGEGKFLKQYTIGVEALGFPSDFDSDNNPVIRIMAGRVRKRLEKFYAENGNNTILISIPKGTYTPVFQYLSVEKTQPLNPQPSVNQSMGPRLALLSFTDKIEGDVSNQFLVNITDLIAKDLSHFIALNLIVHNPFADKSESHGIGTNIESDYVLAIFVKELTNDEFELVCRLAMTVSQEVIWSERYTLDNKKLSQDKVINKISAVVADAQQGRLHIHWGRSLLLNKDNIPDRFKVLAYFRQYYDDFSIESFMEAVAVCNKVLESNKNDILANVMLSDLCCIDYYQGYDYIESSLTKGIKYAQRVIHLRQDYDVGHFLLGQLLFYQEEWTSSIEQLNRSRNCNPHNHAVIDYACGYYLCLMDHWDEGMRLVRNVISLSESYPSWYHLPQFLSLYLNGEYDKALLVARKINTPIVPYGPLSRCISYAQIGDITKAKNELEEVSARIPHLEDAGQKKLFRLFGNNNIVEKIWEGLEIAIKS